MNSLNQMIKQQAAPMTASPENRNTPHALPWPHQLRQKWCINLYREPFGSCLAKDRRTSVKEGEGRVKGKRQPFTSWIPRACRHFKADRWRVKDTRAYALKKKRQNSALLVSSPVMTCCHAKTAHCPIQRQSTILRIASSCTWFDNQQSSRRQWSVKLAQTQCWGAANLI